MDAKKSEAEPPARPQASAPAVLQSLRARINLELEDFLAGMRLRFAPSFSQRIVDEVVRDTLPGGGRLRPLLCCCGYAAVGGAGGATDRRILRAAASLELLHTFAIIHDDVMDSSATRRGQASTSNRASRDYRDSGGSGDPGKFGMSVAILAGDLALVMSDLLLSESGFAPEILHQAYAPLAQMRLDAIAGQYLDLFHSGKAVADLHLARHIARLKSGSYSVEGPLMIGANLGDGTIPAKRALRAFAEPLGEAFQLTDDLMGLLGDPEKTGKDAENDIRQGKPTALLASALARTSGSSRRAILAAWGNADCSHQQIQALKEAVRESGAVKSMVGSIDVLVREAVEALFSAQEVDLDPVPAQLLVHLAEQVSSRAAGPW